MKYLIRLIMLLCLGAGAWWVDFTHPEYRTYVTDLLSPTNFNSLEVKFTAEQIMDTHARSLLKSDEHHFLAPEIKYYPYLLMEVKYALDDRHTSEGVILWDMIDGEMVVSEKQWEKTHGFGDCIKASVDKSEFNIINLLAKPIKK